MSKPSIYFLCTGNSCRSQMAEGFAKKYLGNDYDIFSAGIEAKGVNREAIQVMKEAGLDISTQTSDTVTASLLTGADYVITLCKDAKERCPISIPRSKHYHWGFDDPAKFIGSDEETLEEFRRVRDEIEDSILRFYGGDAGIAISLTEKNLDDLKRREDFGQTIRLLREKMELSTQELATELQVTTDYLLKTEQNTTSPSKFFIHHLARALGMSYEDLVDSLYYVDSNSIDTLLKNN